MADLGELMGALLASVSHARRIADEETVAIAEYYKDNPLLEGMSVPRVRIPELSIELPVLLESFETKSEQQLRPPTVIKKELATALAQSAKDSGTEMPRDFAKQFNITLDKQLSRMRGKASKEAVVRAADLAYINTKRQLVREQQFKITPQQEVEIRNEIKRKASEVAIEKAGAPSILKASILTSEIKEKASAANIARIKITLREEGLEWSSVQTEDGSVRSQLNPE